MVNAQEWLDKEYPKEIRNNITKLDISGKNLEGQMNLQDFVNLEWLDCRNNKITNLKVSYQKIAEIRFNNNQIKDFDFNSLNPEIFTLLWMDNNELYPRDLSTFSRLVNLKELGLEGNPFYGSLKPLNNLHELTSLNINNTDLDSGWEYLPNSIENFGCLSKNPQAKVKFIEQELRSYGEPEKKSDEYYNFTHLLQAWKESCPKKLREFSNLLFPNQPYNFNQLKQEITRLKYQELAPQVRGAKEHFENLVTEAKTKSREGSFAPVIDLLLDTQKKIIESKQNKDQLVQANLEGQLTAYQNTLLQTKLTQEELQDLLNKQTELLKLEKHLASLKQNLEQQSQIEVPPKK